MTCGTRKYRGFSLVEVIVASMILSGAVVAICSVSTRSFLGVKLNRDYELAWDLLDKQLTLIDYMGVDQFLELGETSGMCEPEGAEGVLHYWQAAVVEAGLTGLYTIDIAITWQDGPRVRQITARTMLNSAPAVDETQAREASAEAEQTDTPQARRGGGAQGTAATQGGGRQGGGAQGTTATQAGGRQGGGARGGTQGGGARGGGAQTQPRQRGGGGGR